MKEIFLNNNYKGKNTILSLHNNLLLKLKKVRKNTEFNKKIKI